MKEIQCIAIKENFRTLLSMATEEMVMAQCPTSLRQRLFIVLEELFLNVANHAYKDQPEPGILKVKIQANEEAIELCIEDRGIAFNPFEHEYEKKEKNLDNFEAGGEGILLVKSLSAQYKYTYIPPWNRIEILLETPDY